MSVIRFVRKSLRNRFLVWGATTLWWIALTLGSLIKVSKDIKLPSFGFDKIVHFVLYMVLAFLLGSALMNGRSGKLSAILITAGATILYGSFIELVQPLFGRGMDSGDLIANIIGSVTGITLLLIERRKSL